ncbi:response regulator [Alkalimarinus sediminis]|uniref:Response regulator n=1 Tax=Alkalimarinus sediminis TaxID=1632866 RepID=A0A9E8KIJ1_9ALTE|nr:response regulator [Alkalimarinus sediminis]UZW73986.1 response regulator [Alkalimarinus sediminis]
MAKIKALVVDDASFVRDLVKRTIRTSFPTIELEEAVNGKKAQAIMERGTFDLILCDWEMPEMSGLELLRWARQSDSYKKTPFIMITSRGDRDHVMEAVKEGVSGYLGKPFSPEQLSGRIVKAIGSKLKKAPPSQSSPLQDAFKNSASVLTGAPVTAKAPPAANQTASLLTGSTSGMEQVKKAAPKKAGAGQSGSKGAAEVRFADSTLKCIIKAISLTEIKVIAKREAQFPGILESAVVDLELEGEVARLNGYVHQLQAVDKRMDTDFVSIIIRFVDEDPQKMEHLSKYMAKF